MCLIWTSHNFVVMEPIYLRNDGSRMFNVFHQYFNWYGVMIKISCLGYDKLVSTLKLVNETIILLDRYFQKMISMDYLNRNRKINNCLCAASILLLGRRILSATSAVIQLNIVLVLLHKLGRKRGSCEALFFIRI